MNISQDLHMNFNLIKPCVDCPFRNDIAFFLSEERRREIANHLLSDGTFECHKTTKGEWDDDWNYQTAGEESHCAGALITMLKSKKLEANWLLRFAAGRGLLDLDSLDRSAPVFDTLDLFVQGDPG